MPLHLPWQQAPRTSPELGTGPWDAALSGGTAQNPAPRRRGTAVPHCSGSPVGDRVLALLERPHALGHEGHVAHVHLQVAHHRLRSRFRGLGLRIRVSRLSQLDFWAETCSASSCAQPGPSRARQWRLATSTALLVVHMAALAVRVQGTQRPQACRLPSTLASRPGSSDHAKGCNRQCCDQVKLWQPQHRQTVVAAAARPTAQADPSGSGADSRSSPPCQLRWCPHGHPRSRQPR